jgi:nucleoprotein TPR
VEKIQQINLLRESNATLRADSEAHAKRSRELDVKLKTLIQELDPLRERARTMKAELDARNEQVGRLEEENRRWQERNSQLLTKVTYPSVVCCAVVARADSCVTVRSRRSH